MGPFHAKSSGQIAIWGFLAKSFLWAWHWPLFTNRSPILTHRAAIGAHSAPDSPADNDELRRLRWRPSSSELAKRSTPTAYQWGLVVGEGHWPELLKNYSALSG